MTFPEFSGISLHKAFLEGDDVDMFGSDGPSGHMVFKES